MTIRCRRHDLTGKFIQPHSGRHMPAEHSQTVSQQMLQTGHGQSTQHTQAQGIAIRRGQPVLAGKLIEQAGRLGKMIGRLRQLGWRSRKTLNQRRKNGMTEKIPAIASISIALILDPGKFMGIGIGQQCGTRHIEQRPQEVQGGHGAHRPHAAGTGQASTAQEVEEDGFSLIILMMRQAKLCDASRLECCITGVTCLSLQTMRGIAPDCDTQDLAIDAQTG